MFNLLTLNPVTRVNDSFVQDQTIDASPSNVSIRHPLILPEPKSWPVTDQVLFYQHIACDIVVETVFKYPYPYVSEKTLRPMACKRMFIVLGPPGVLKLLHSMGFKTFDDFINEDYDNISDPIDRFLAVNEQIHQLCDRPLEEIVQYLQTNESKFDHNFSNLVGLQEKEIKEISSKLK